jgi:hypothetical protein
VGAQEAREDREGQGRGETHTQAARPAAAHRAGRREALREVGERLTGGGEEFPARGRQRHPPWRAREQGMADLLLKTPDLLAQGWLRDAQAGRRVAEVQFLGEDDEGVQLREREFRALHPTDHMARRIE